jgi:hypothetical protein
MRMGGSKWSGRVKKKGEGNEEMEMELRLISPFPSTTSTHKIHKQINEQKYNQIKIKKFHGKKLMGSIQKKSKPKTF